MPLNRYAFAHAISGFFEFPTDNAHALLPRQLEPIELHHGSSVLSITVFDFVESLVGPYRELVMAVAVMPLVKTGERMPKSALYPWVVGTSTPAARNHAITTWHLPHWMEDLDVQIAAGEGRIEARVSAAGAPVADLSVAEHSWEPVKHLYQSFMMDGDQLYVADIRMDGTQSEHEDEAGRLELYEHPFHGALSRADVSDVPFREVWMRDGVQVIENLVSYPAA
jgi:hypothetical protein